MCQRSRVNVEFGNAARCTSTRSGALRRVDDLDPEAAVVHRVGEVTRQWRPRLVRDPTTLGEEPSEGGAGPSLDTRVVGGQHATLRIRQSASSRAANASSRSTIGATPIRTRPGILHEADGHDLPVPTPHPNGGGQVLRAQFPVPPEVTRMKLDRRPFLLPGRQRLGDLVQRVGGRGLQRDGHGPIQVHSRTSTHLVCRAECAGPSCAPGSNGPVSAGAGPRAPAARRRRLPRPRRRRPPSPRRTRRRPPRRTARSCRR